MNWLEGTRLEPALFDPDVTHFIFFKKKDKQAAIPTSGADVQNLAFI
jgi:hypothetical protein